MEAYIKIHFPFKMEDAESELQRLESNHSELLLHQETLKKQLAFKNDQLKLFQAAVEECQKLLAQSPPVESDVVMAMAE
ncbi:hypothetical protein PF001_g11617 [Phytophthora fragariae]|uniref:Uncharacterized protein n=1 Tax=Phytophthora fragariae TaxID=53985 RepID=A0A6A4DTQ0_9STRA|nr:hypothetical protein PF001_g11617 [Phytophthora fragariae]